MNAFRFSFYNSLCVLFHNTDRLKSLLICFKLDLQFILCFWHFVSKWFVNSYFCVRALEGGNFEAAYHQCVSAVATEDKENGCFDVLDLFKTFVSLFKAESPKWVWLRRTLLGILCAVVIHVWMVWLHLSVCIDEMYMWINKLFYTSKPHLFLKYNRSEYLFGNQHSFELDMGETGWNTQGGTVSFFSCKSKAFELAVTKPPH